MKAMLFIMIGGLLMACSSPPQQSTTPATTGPSPAPPAVESGQLAPTSGPLRPQPHLTPEEREQLLRGTKIIDPRTATEQPPSPPGLPLERGEETEVAPCPQAPGPCPHH